MIARQTVARWLWRIPVCTAVLAASLGAERFLKEIEIATRLTHPPSILRPSIHTHVVYVEPLR